MSKELQRIENMLRKHSVESEMFRNEMRKKVSDQNVALARIEFVLMGDEPTKTDGLVQKVDKHGKEIEKGKKLKWTIAGIFIAGFGGIAAYIKSLLHS